MLSKPSTAFTPSSTSGTAFPELSPLINPSSTQTLTQLLSDNHVTHHCFFNSLGMHNHSSHQLIADFTLGANPAQLSAHYEYQKSHYLNKFNLHDRTKFGPNIPNADVAHSDKDKQPIEPINESNWKDHLGNSRYYWAYLHFFDSFVEKMGAREALEELVFSKEANEGEVKMITRFYGGVLHALIHVGYGLETGMKGMVSEGLAMASVTAASHSWLFDHKWLTSTRSKQAGQQDLFSLVAELQRDPRVSPDSLKLRDEESSLPDKPFLPGGSGEGVIWEYVDRWQALTEGNKEGEERAVGELAVLGGLLLGAVPKSEKGNWFRHDFFLMHLNNAHVFTPLYLSLFASSPSSLRLRPIFLRALLAQFMYYYISRGRPLLSLSNLASTDPLSWGPMLEVARENVDEHVPKAVRTLYVYHQRHGHLLPEVVQSGLVIGKETDSVETLFQRTAEQLIRMHRGELKPSKYADEQSSRRGESVGAHQEFWSFEEFY
ncbi:uncharacterized protein UHO2_05905 [Ustilago hordei]|uniref:HypA-like protein n=1 Tax=Ustilago hordei TaxID=120017 RepID=I2FTG5_USTHO|nr:uncharacterized protein UHO2_05905 [Ustilago hordei]KAJ1572602.1 hypothetical protein NDA12_006993 [Ustilago hordei]KAJ1576157.1 hypothetical protein NDA15_003361 [Ustilago hordei]CCF50208.1 uncharacterized protein UHOR_07233 [Ustilago hordei]SYW83284.1 uncharacterized protein UHO2_05905 [Ustilago hordei]